MPASVDGAGIVVPACFPRAARVRAKVEFDRVFEAGKRTADPLLALHRLDDGAPPRLGLAVSRKVDPHAVGRNRIKRVLRDAFRHARGQLGNGAYVIVARPSARQVDNAALRATFLRLLQRAGALPATAAAGTMPPAPPPSP
ncbi:MAG: ribonuclease P protein component [Lysobacteraceae bacterium]|nr:MAG: ribonuclease P protein component [Xanthomonadaceae bacterium]